ncbi:hypothetical protein [Nocardia sp. alder85J]|uniref:hypothetical protein n=1 Tax=Nocardia sp. alder85J TaxID=2862949 RepID=UPI001CD248FA|nr:hypothetical protein [Nocardia sp. alder85J]MCX4094405.1 hypothetical protein [Nocardia sp. alder85J]
MTTDTAPAPDPIMTAIGEAVTAGHHGDPDRARADLTALWERVGVTGDPLHRCTIGHYLADLYDDPAEALVWDIRALDAADALTDERAQRHHAGLSVAGFYPSLHLNLADNYRRLGSFAAAHRHLDAARARLDTLADDGYGSIVRLGITNVETALATGSTDRLPTH